MQIQSLSWLASVVISWCRLLRISRLYTGVGVIFSLREENELRANGTSVRTPQSERALRSARVSRLWTKIRQRVTQPLSQWCYPRTTLLSLRDSSYLSLISFLIRLTARREVKRKTGLVDHFGRVIAQMCLDSDPWQPSKQITFSKQRVSIKT